MLVGDTGNYEVEIENYSYHATTAKYFCDPRETMHDREVWFGESCFQILPKNDVLWLIKCATDDQQGMKDSSAVYLTVVPELTAFSLCLSLSL